MEPTIICCEIISEELHVVHQRSALHKLFLDLESLTTDHILGRCVYSGSSPPPPQLLSSALVVIVPSGSGSISRIMGVHLYKWAVQRVGVQFFFPGVISKGKLGDQGAQIYNKVLVGVKVKRKVEVRRSPGSL